MGVGAAVSALYLHIPFCVRRCRYCDFATATCGHGDALVGAYVAALEALVARVAEAGLLAGARTAYVGGGTPTMAGEGLPGLVGAVRAACPHLAEFSSEANPESLDAGLAARLAQAGLTRVSLGVQSLDDAELVRLGRAHDARGARAACAAVRAAGLDLSCDLMCGIPLQTLASWEASLRGVLEGGAGHVSCYPLMVEDGTPLAAAVDAGRESLPDDDLQADLMLAAERVLGAAGLARYEVASYAQPGKACAHNAAYWTGAPYLGLGTSAAGMLDPAGFFALADTLPLACTPEDAGAAGAGLWGSAGILDAPELARRAREAGLERVARVRLRMVDDARALVERVAEGAPLAVAVEVLSAREALAEDLMLGLRMTSGAAPALCERARASFGRAFEEAVDGVERAGLARCTPAGGLAPTERGWLLGNELFGVLWGLAEA